MAGRKELLATASSPKNATLIDLIALVACFGCIGIVTCAPTVPSAGSPQEASRRSVIDEYCVRTNGRLDCGGPLRAFDCDSFQNPSPFLDNLVPFYPLLTCEKREIRGQETSEGVARTPGVGWLSTWIIVIDYVALKDEGFEVLASRDQFNATFAPVTSAGEALGFIAAFRKGQIVFDTAPLKELQGGSYKLAPARIRATSAESVPEGFAVNVFSDHGTCASEVYERRFLVHQNGSIEEVESILIWESERKPRCDY